MTLDTQDDLEQQVDLPPTAADSTGHDDIVAAALAEGELEGRLGQLGELDGDYTAEQLRGALGDAAEGLTDDELLAEWKKAQAAEAQPETDATPEKTETAETPEPIKLEGFKLYDSAGKEIVDLTKVSAADLLTGKVQIGYNAMKGEQRKALRDLTRVASLGHYNEKVLLDTRAERQQAVQRALAAESKVAEFSSIQRTWDQALTALINGNPEPIQRLAYAYQRALAQGGVAPQAGQAPTGAQEAQWDSDGQQFFNDTIVPRASELATQYGANAIEVAQYILYLCNQEGEFLTPDKIQAILQYEMPAILESRGFSASGKAAVPQADGDPRDAKIADLTKRLAAIEAGKANDSTQKLRDKSKKVPPAGGGSTGGTVTVPEMKSREDMKRFLRDES